MRRTDVVVAAVALAGCAVAFWLTYRFATTPAAMMSGMGAEVFPRLVIGVIALLAVLAAFGIGNPPMETPAPVPRMVWITAAVLLAFVGAVELIGMWPAALVFLVGLGRCGASAACGSSPRAQWCFAPSCMGCSCASSEEISPRA